MLLECAEEPVPSVAFEQTFRDKRVGGEVDCPAFAVFRGCNRRRTIHECADYLNVPRLLNNAPIVLIVSAILYKTWYKRLEED